MLNFVLPEKRLVLSELKTKPKYFGPIGLIQSRLQEQYKRAIATSRCHTCSTVTIFKKQQQSNSLCNSVTSTGTNKKQSDTV